MRFEEKLRKNMMLKGYNQQKLARLSGVSDSEISRILSGKSGNPGLENALRLARAVGVSLDYLADDALDQDPVSAAEAATSESFPDNAEGEILLAARDLGLRPARRILETACDLGYEVAIRRLLDIRPLIELGDSPRSAPAQRNLVATASERRASSG